MDPGFWDEDQQYWANFLPIAPGGTSYRTYLGFDETHLVEVNLTLVGNNSNIQGALAMLGAGEIRPDVSLSRCFAAPTEISSH
jgi:hypothetical protein